MVRSAALVTVRNSSTRLPHKALAEIRPGLRAIDCVLQRAKLIETEVILTTSTDRSDDVFEEIAREQGVQIFRGALQNKIKRWHDCFQTHGLELALLVDGDDLAYGFELGQRALSLLARYDDGALLVRHPPDIVCGLFTYGLNVQAMERLHAVAKAEDLDTDVITEFLHQARIKEALLELFPHEQGRNFRLTLDYKEDLQMFQALYAKVDVLSPTQELISFLDDHPEVVEINLFRQADYLQNQSNFNKRVKKGGE